MPIHDRTELVANTLRTITRTLTEALVIVIVVLSLMLGSVRAALITAVTIPLSLFFAFVCMHFAGIPANLLSLGAIDFGIIVDGNLVMVQHILRRLEERRHAPHERSVDDTIRRAAIEMQRPVFFSMVIIIAAYFPLFTLERVERRLFTPMAYTVCFALSARCSWRSRSCPCWPPGSSATVRARGAIRCSSGCSIGTRGRPVDARARPSRHRHGIRARGAGLALAGAVGTEFLPQLDEGVIWIRSNLTPGISLEESAETAARMRQLIRQSPEVKMVMSQTGRNDSGMDPFGPNRNELLIELNPYPRGRRARPSAISSTSCRSASTATFLAPPSTLRSRSSTRPPRSPPARRRIWRSSSPGLICPAAAPGWRGAGGRQDRAGAADTSIEQEADQSQLRIAVDRAMLARYGLTISDVQDVIELAIGGRAVGVVFEGERRFDLTVRYLAGRADRSGGDRTDSGRDAWRGARAVGQLARVETVRGPSIIARRENQRQITVRTNIRERDQGGFVAEAQANVLAGREAASGYRVSWGGQFENLAQGTRAPGAHPPGNDRHRIRPAVRGLRVGARRLARARQRALLAGRRNSRALPARHPPVGLGGRRIRDIVRRRRDGWTAVRGGDQSPAGRARSVVTGRRRVGSEVAGAPDVHADCGRDAGDDSRGGRNRDWIGHPAPSRHRDRRRIGLDAAVDVAGAAEPVLCHGWTDDTGPHGLPNYSGSGTIMTGEPPPAIAAPAKLLLAIFDQRDEWSGEPLHEALMRVLEAHGIAGATVVHGLTGYGAHRGVHRRGLIGLPHDKPIAMFVIDSEAKLRAVLPALRPMIAQGIVILTDAEVIPLP